MTDEELMALGLQAKRNQVYAGHGERPLPVEVDAGTLLELVEEVLRLRQKLAQEEHPKEKAPVVELDEYRVSNWKGMAKVLEAYADTDMAQSAGWNVLRDMVGHLAQARTRAQEAAAQAHLRDGGCTFVTRKEGGRATMCLRTARDGHYTCDKHSANEPGPRARSMLAKLVGPR